MAPAEPTTEKKQRSLTSFFTPKAVNGLASSLQKQSPGSSPTPATHEPEPPTRKRPVAEDAAEGAVKKTRPSPPSPERSSFFEPATATDQNGRTSTFRRNLHRSPRPAAGNDADADADDAETDRQNPSPDVKRRNEELHRKFVKKLGNPDALRWRRPGARDDAAGGEDEVADAALEEEDLPAPVQTKKKSGGKPGKLTPMELQFLEIKRKHMDTVLIVEVGYKFRFFGEDARIAAKELSIVCIPGKMRYDERMSPCNEPQALTDHNLALDPSEAHLDRFASASIPVHRLPVHAKRLVAAGHKVGVVRQIETAALKKAGDNRNAPFVRKLTNLYTKGTYVDENGELDQRSEGSASSGGYLLCITETNAKGWRTDDKVDVGILAVQPATGDIIWDNFEDGFMRSEIETRMLHISPCEFLIVGELTKGTDKLIQHLSASSTNVFGDRSRVERVPRGKTMAVEAYSHVTQFYADQVKGAARSEAASALLDKAVKLPEPVIICLSAMIHHLKEYGLEHIFNLTEYFQSFTTRSHMLINGTTLESLEIYRNSTDHADKGSLFWALDKTLTRFGQRLLRRWVGRPLLDRQHLEERLASVQELVDKQSTAPVDQLEKLLAATKTDLERSLIRVYYGKCTRPELLSVLQTLQRISRQYAPLKPPQDTYFDTPLLNDAVRTLPQILDTIVSYLERINLNAAREDDKYGFFRDSYQTDAIQDHQLGIAHVEHELDTHRAVAAEKIGKGKIDYVTVAGIEYLIEVPNSDIKNVPASWTKVSGTKKLSRFHTPEVLLMVAERDQHREALAAACDDAFKDLLAAISADYQPLRDAVSALATLDCLLCLSKVASQPGYAKPTFLPVSSEPKISISNGRHPIAEHTLDGGYIPFSTTLAHPSPLAHLITGPNMGGKSSFVRAFALIVLLAQIGSFVPADSVTLTLCDAIHTRTGARDNLFAGESTFMVEVSETARILRSSTPRSLVILDELGRGTSTHDGAAIAQAVLQHVVAETRCLTLFITHYQNLARVAQSLDGVTNVHMKFKADKSLDGDEEITFLYEVGEGIAHRSYGLNVARLAHIPRKILDVAAQKSAEMEQDMMARRLKGATRALADVLSEKLDQIDHLVDNIEQL